MSTNLRGLTIGVLLSVGVLGAQLRPAQVIILLGPPGSGKSAQAKLLSTTYKVPAISMASLLQQEMGKKTPLAKALASAVASGELVSDDAANEVMQARLLRPDASRGFILDGYPVSEGQAQALDRFLADHQFSKPIVVVLDVPDNVLRERMKTRRRIDDTPDNIERRIREYRAIEAFTSGRYGGDNAVRVDGTGSIQMVAAAVAQQIDGVRSRKGFASRPEPSPEEPPQFKRRPAAQP